MAEPEDILAEVERIIREEGVLDTPPDPSSDYERGLHFCAEAILKRVKALQKSRSVGSFSKTAAFKEFRLENTRLERWNIGGEGIPFIEVLYQPETNAHSTLGGLLPTAGQVNPETAKEYDPDLPFRDGVGPLGTFEITVKFTPKS